MPDDATLSTKIPTDVVKRAGEALIPYVNGESFVAHGYVKPALAVLDAIGYDALVAERDRLRKLARGLASAIRLGGSNADLCLYLDAALKAQGLDDQGLNPQVFAEESGA